METGDGEAMAIGRIRGAGKRKSAPKRSKKTAKRINWSGVREEYVTGSESYAQIAKRLGVTKGAVEQQAAAMAEVGQSWVEARAEFQESVARTFRMEAQKRQVDEALSVHDAQAKAVKDLVAAALPLALAKLNEGSLGGYEAVRAVISALGAQRRVHGLDRATRVEVTGKDGAAIEHDIAFGVELDDSTRTVAERALEALFGKTPESS